MFGAEFDEQIDDAVHDFDGELAVDVGIGNAAVQGAGQHLLEIEDENWTGGEK